MSNKLEFNYEQGEATIALILPGYYVWDNSVIKAEGKYWMFSSRWEGERGFGWNWLMNSRVILSVSDKPEGPFKFVKEVTPRRGKKYFDGMNTHNTCIKEYNGKFYLYYMGTTYDFEPPAKASDINEDMASDVWKKKRIGLAISDKIDGEYIRKDEPILLPNPYPAWDSTITTNPTVVIKDNGETVMAYKSSRCLGNICREPNELKIGLTTAPNPEGPFVRKYDYPIFQANDKKMSIEDPFIWFDEKKNKFCLLCKDCEGNITGEFGDMVYAESENLLDFELLDDHAVFTRDVTWKDGHKSKQCNLERPFILFENGEPTYLYCSSGDGNQPYGFQGETYIVCLKINKISNC